MERTKILPSLPSPRVLIPPLRRFAVITFIVWPMLGMYMLINHYQPATQTTVVMPSWVPFCPAFFTPYFGLLFVTWLLPVAIHDAGLFRACLWANICAWFLVMPWWILTPTMLGRPPMPEGSWADTCQFLWTVDQPYNVMPCAHGIGPIVAAWFVSRDRSTWRWPLAAIIALALPSIALTWQHRPIDILLGTVAAAIGIAFGEMLNRRKRAAAQSQAVRVVEN